MGLRMIKIILGQIIDDQTNECVIVDPTWDVEKLLRFISWK